MNRMNNCSIYGTKVDFFAGTVKTDVFIWRSSADLTPYDDDPWRLPTPSFHNYVNSAYGDDKTLYFIGLSCNQLFFEIGQELERYRFDAD